MLLRTIRAAPRLLRTSHRHKASAVAALHHRGDDAATHATIAKVHDDDDDAAARATIAKVVSCYARTQEQLVPWFLAQMPRSYFTLVPEASQHAHLQAAAGLFDPARGFDVLDEVRAASSDDGTVTYLTSGNAPGALAQQVRTLAGQGELTGLKVFTSRDETLCLNVFTFNTKPEPGDAEDALRQHLAYAKAKGGAGFWSEVFVRAYAEKCSAAYILGTRPARWARQRSLFERVAGTESVKARVDAFNGSAWLTLAAPNTLPASFLHKVLRLVAAHSLDVKRAHMDTVDDCLILRVLLDGTPRDWEDVAQVAERLKWLGESSLKPLFAAGAPTAQDATRLEVRYALETLAHRTLGGAFPRDRIANVLKRHGDLADAAAKLLLGDGDVQDLLASVEAVADGDEKAILTEVVRHAATCLQTNVGRADRQALALVIDPNTLSDDHKAPARVVFVAGRRFDAFHVSMRPVARGGVRLVTPKTPEALAHASTRHYDECRDLAQAQQLKNKDIPEGGAKAVILVDATGHGDDAWAGKGRHAFREYLNRKAIQAFADALLDVSLESEAPLPYLGPDEQVIPQDIERIVTNAKRRNHPRPDALMSSKPGAGISHKEFGVTSEGVAVFVERALREVGVDARRDAFRVSLAGGPDGDVAGNLLKIMGRDWPVARVVGIADGSGCAEDPEGLDGNELRRLVELSLPITSFDAKLLGHRGSLRTADDTTGATLRDAMHLRVDADVFVPCGGRPGTIHAGNARDFLKPGDDGAPGAPRAPIIVEGANLFLTPEARQILHAEASVLIVKDSSANKCGVVCSSYEILAAHLLSRTAFEAQKDIIVGEVLARLRELASLEADLLFREYGRFPGALPDFSLRISEAINSVADAVAATATEDQVSALFRDLAPEHLPPTLARLAVDSPDRLPGSYARACVGAFSAARLVYGEGITHVEALGQDPARLAAAATNYVRAQTDVARLREQVLASQDLDDSTKNSVVDLLRPSLS